jgi:hypothetical protein
MSQGEDMAPRTAVLSTREAAAIWTRALGWEVDEERMREWLRRDHWRMRGVDRFQMVKGAAYSIDKEQMLARIEEIGTRMVMVAREERGRK